MGTCKHVSNFQLPVAHEEPAQGIKTNPPPLDNCRAEAETQQTKTSKSRKFHRNPEQPCAAPKPHDKASTHVGSSLNWVSLLGSFFIRVPYYIVDLKRDPNLENYLCVHRIVAMTVAIARRANAFDPNTNPKPLQQHAGNVIHHHVNL